MSKKKESSDFSARIERVRERLGYADKSAFAAALGVERGTYSSWATRDVSPSGAGLKRALKTLRNPSGKPLSERPRLLDWLVDGEDEPPAWLEDATLDPYAPEIPLPPSSPRPAPAMPQGAAVKLRSARNELRGEIAQASGMVGGGVLRALADLDDSFKLLPWLETEEIRRIGKLAPVLFLVMMLNGCFDLRSDLQRICNPLPYHLAMPPRIWARILRKLLALSKTRGAAAPVASGPASGARRVA